MSRPKDTYSLPLATTSGALASQAAEAKPAAERIAAVLSNCIGCSS